MKLATAFAISALALFAVNAPVSAEIKIGVTLPLTGYAASYGEDARRGAELAVDQANAAGGIKGEKIKLVIEDDAGAGKTGVAATQKLVSIDKVPVIIGGMMSSVALPASQIARSNKIVYLSTTSSHPELTSAGGFIYRLASSSAAQSPIAVEYSVGVLKAKTAVGLFAASETGLVAGKLIETGFEKHGGKWLASDKFQTGATDFRTQLAKLKEHKADILFIIATHKESAQIFRQMVELNFKPQVMGSSFWYDPTIFDLAGDAANGVYFTVEAREDNPDSKKLSAEFTAAFKAKYNKDPGITASYFYDATQLAISAVKNAGPSGPAIDRWIANVKSYPGITGHITFTAIGDSIIPMTVRKIENRKFVETGFTRTIK
jgi:branched-chain amino acid transport system substrate-binding protein